MDAGLGAADAAVRIATASFLSSVSLAVDYGFQGQELSFGSNEDFLVASVVVSWNLFNGGSDLARRQAAGADPDRIRVQRRDVADHIRLEVRQAYESAVVAQAAIGTAEDSTGGGAPDVRARATPLRRGCRQPDRVRGRAAVPIGAYRPADVMRFVHTTPEEALRIGQDVSAHRIVAMHFGTFDLAHEPLDEPPQRFQAEAEQLGLGADRAWILDIGETREW